MATTITTECINCGACEPECPNTAIYGGGVPWELNGETHPAIAQDIYYIVPEKCTECVGFYDHEACAAVCPVDCCIPDPANLESEAVLIERAKVLHPEQAFGADFPSRFRKEGADAAPAAAHGDGHGAAAKAADGAPSAAPTAAPAPKPAAAPTPASAASSKSAAAAAPIAMMNLPKDVGALPGPIGEKHFAGELDDDFDTCLAAVETGPLKGAPAPVQIAMRLAEPVLGAMPEGAKARLEESVGSAGFSRARSTALNIVLNLILYPGIFIAFSVAVLGDPLFSLNTRGWITLGLLIGSVEALWRLREGIFQARPASELVYRGCAYGFALAPLGAILARGARLGRSIRKVSFDGFTSDQHDPKLERDRRYGTVYTVMEHANAYLVRLEMPRRIPASSLKRLWNLPDEMPDYDYSIALEDGVLAISASVRGEAFRRLSYISSAFPPDFLTRIEFDKPVWTFKHRLRDKILEIIVFKGETGEIRNAA